MSLLKISSISALTSTFIFQLFLVNQWLWHVSRELGGETPGSPDPLKVNRRSREVKDKDTPRLALHRRRLNTAVELASPYRSIQRNLPLITEFPESQSAVVAVSCLSRFRMGAMASRRPVRLPSLHFATSRSIDRSTFVTEQHPRLGAFR
jgi:hypothetical protein